ncbi:hypothetical protein INR49_000270 [Caranx melampygus]|nr:hypothetical protein INR49_000270 [Caranx melampygus]
MEIIVNVIDRMHKPIFSQSTYLGDVPEASAKGFEVLRVEATDIDAPNTDNSEIRYSILSQTPQLPSDSLFDIDPVSGVIRVNAGGLDRETAADPQVPALVFPNSGDGLRRRKREWVIPPISVTENDRGPYPLLVSQIRSTEGKVKNIYYSITGPGADQPPVNLFTMERYTGILYVTQPLDREQVAKYLLQVHAVAEGSGNAEEPVEILVNVIDQNDNAPVFSQATYQGDVPEASARDIDAPNTDNSEIRYSILSQTPQLPSNSLFDINPVSGVIRVNAGGLDREKYPEYTLVVQAADMVGEGLTGTCKVILTITDSNNNAPVFTQDSTAADPQVPALVFPNSGDGLRRRKREWVIPPISVTENDRGPYPLLVSQIRSTEGKVKNIYYSITGPGADQPPVNLFTMERYTGILYVTQPLDREQVAKYLLQVHAVAEGSGNAEEPVEILVNVIDQNDNAPVFSQATYQGDKYPEYTLVVQAADMVGVGLTGTCKVILTVTDSNNNAPVFTQDSTAADPQVPVLVFPNSGDGLRRRKREWVIPPISVTENDRGPYPLRIRSNEDKVKKIHYSITGPGADQPPVNLFTMDRDTGILYVTQPLDREQVAKHLLQAHAVAEGSGNAEEPMEIIVNVIDQNDNAPVFSQATYQGDVPEASARDIDAPNTDNSDIRYRILSQTPPLPSDSLFDINPVSGVIRVNAGGLDREKYPEYTLLVQAADMVGVGLTGTCKVILTVTVEDSAPPQFWRCENS